MVDIQNTSSMSTILTYEVALTWFLWYTLRLFLENSIQIIMNDRHRDPKTSTRTSGWVWRHSINNRFGPNTNTNQQINNLPQHRIPLEGNPSDKLKEPHRQVKFISKCSIIHWNHIHPRSYFHPCFWFINIDVLEILHRIGWFTSRNQNWVTVKLVEYFSCIPNPRTLPLNREPGPHWHNKIV